LLSLLRIAQGGKFEISIQKSIDISFPRTAVLALSEEWKYQAPLRYVWEHAWTDTEKEEGQCQAIAWYNPLVDEYKPFPVAWTH